MPRQKQKAPITQKFDGYGILNHYGQFWSHNVFDNMDEAIKYIALFQTNNPQCDLSKHRVVPVRQTMRQIAE